MTMQSPSPTRGEPVWATGELVKFLDLAAACSEFLSPSPAVDGVWHRALEADGQYEEFCRQRYGRVLPHIPGGDPEMLRAAYRRTQDLMVERYGSIDRSLWPAAAFVGCGVRAPVDPRERA